MQIKDNFVHIFIRNTGILQQLDPGGLGLVNTLQRLALIFGNQASFAITQEFEEVVCAKLMLPLKPIEEVSNIKNAEKSDN